MTLTQEGWRRGRGYGSPAAAREIETLEAMGVNAVALVPYAFAASTGETGVRFRMSRERDEALATTARHARGLGMTVLLKPQLWMRGGRFTGDVRIDDPVRRSRWMADYHTFILHYAGLAEREGIALLAIGTELGGLTAHEGDWRRLIAEVRTVYGGQLTYAANWGDEFESVAFWDALDYMGLNNYYPLVETPDADRAAHARGAENVVRRVGAVQDRWRKPLLLTEVGYPSRHGAAARPWREEFSAEVSLDAQAAAYEATFRAFAHQPWVQGMFWWKWPSDGRGGGPTDGSYTPLGKPSTGILRTWYARLIAEGF